WLFFTFFFQAEDGIRDYKVTGVQTCALPIFRTHFSQVPQFSPGTSPSQHTLMLFTAASHSVISLTFSKRLSSKPSLSTGKLHVRSEERRVGKECRARR